MPVRTRPRASGGQRGLLTGLRNFGNGFNLLRADVDRSRVLACFGLDCDSP
jgi:hypothetical protein